MEHCRSSVLAYILVGCPASLRGGCNGTLEDIPQAQAGASADSGAKGGNRFAGKLDAYVTVQPEDTEEIVPLTFPIN